MESQIEKLKQKYWEGKTSVEEERILKKSLKNETSKSIEKQFFAELEKRKDVESSKKFTMPQRRMKILWQVSTVAATIIILITFAFGFLNTNNDDQFVIDDPEQAYKISQQALMLVSSKLNKGKPYSARMGKINEIKQIISK